MANASKNGTLLQTKVLGRIPPSNRKPSAIGSAPSFPGAPKEPGKAHQKGRPVKPKSAFEETGAEDDTVLEATSWGASDPAIRAQLERELKGIREQLILRQQISAAKRELSSGELPHSGVARYETVRDGYLHPSGENAFSERELDALSMRSLNLSQIGEPPVVDKEENRLAKRVKMFEATLVRKLIARTPLGPSADVGAHRAIIKAFSWSDAHGDGTVDLPTLTKVLHDKFNAVSQLPPTVPEKEVLAALFQKYAKGATELNYSTFARELLRNQQVLVPAAEARNQNQREEWSYTAPVQQALSRRNLATSSATVPDPGPREAWVDHSAAARAKEEAAAYTFAPRREAIGAWTGGAAIRGRLPGGPGGLAQLKAMEGQRRKALAAQRKEEWGAAREDAEQARRRAGIMVSGQR